MCGRFACTLEPDELCKACQYKDSTGKRRAVNWQAEEAGDGRRYRPMYNLSPTDVAPCLLAGQHFKSEEERVLHPMIWGLIPRWHKGDYRKHGMSTHNARFEGLLTSKLYSHPLAQGRRCIIICDGYYEWKSKGNKKGSVKQPYFVYAKQEDGIKIEDRNNWKNELEKEEQEEEEEGKGWKNGIKLLKMAGIFDSWLSAEGKKIYSCTILTTNSDEVLSRLHNRVPIFLENEDEVAVWLDYEISSKEAIKKLHGPTKDFLRWHPVDPNVNNSRYQSDSCYRPIEIVEEQKKEKASGSGPMAAWLKTGSMTAQKKRKSTDDDGPQSPESETKRSKSK